MAEIQWTAPAFVQLEALPQSFAFEVIRHVEVLSAFPESGARVEGADPGLGKCRQLVLNRSYRVIYEYEQNVDMVYILVVQHCRQRLPTGRDLKRRQSDEED